MNVVASEIMNRLGDEYVSLPELTAVIERDPATSARLLGLANSAMYQLPNPVLSLQHAVVNVLGLNVTRAVCLGIAFSSMLKIQQCAVETQKAIWLDTMLIANCTREITANIPAHASYSAIAYTGALLSNLGLLVLASSHPERLDECLLKSSSGGDLKDSVLFEEFGFDHRVVAAALAAKWKLPEDLMPLITLNADSAPAPFDKLVEYARHGRTLIDNHQSSGAPVAESYLPDLSEEISGALLGVTQRFDRLRSDSELAARAISSTH